MTRTIEKIQKEIDKINTENRSLVNKREVNQFKLMSLENEIKEIKEKSLMDWHEKNPLQKYYKKLTSLLHNCVDESYINIYDDIVSEYDGNIKRMVDSSLYPKVEYINIEFGEQGQIECVHYRNPNPINVGQFLHEKGDKPGNHGEWTPITEEEFEEAKKKIKEFFNKI